MDTMNKQEMVSALLDGQLRGDAFARAVEAAATDPEAREAWQAYHLVGDVLRSGGASAGVAPRAFMDKLSAKLAAEPGFAMQSIAIEVQPMRAEAAQDSRKEAANDSAFRWKMVAGFASLAAVAAVGWTVSGLGKNEGPQLAAVPPASTTVLAGTERGVMIRDARLDELLAAHRQLGGAPGLPMPAGFLRNATFEGPAR